MVPDDVGCENLSRPRIDIAGSHRVCNWGSCILDTTVAHVIRIERRVVRRIIYRTHHILETRGFKSPVPVFDPLFHCTPPFVWKGRIYIKHQRFLRFDQFAPEITLHILLFRTNAPAIDVGPLHNAIMPRCVQLLHVVKKAHPIVLQTARHRVIRQHKKRAVHHHSVRTIEWRKIVGQKALHFDILRKSLHLHDIRAICLKRTF